MKRISERKCALKVCQVHLFPYFDLDVLQMSPGLQAQNSKTLDYKRDCIQSLQMLKMVLLGRAILAQSICSEAHHMTRTW